MWMVKTYVFRTLGVFQHRVACRMTVNQPQRLTKGGWENLPPSEKATMEAGLKAVDEYITWRNNTVMKYIAMRMIIEICEEAERWSEIQV